MSSKLKSRKFWITILGEVLGIATALSGMGGDIGLVSGIIVAAVSGITFVITEGKIDAASVDVTADTVKKILAIYDEVKDEK